MDNDFGIKIDAEGKAEGKTDSETTSSSKVEQKEDPLSSPSSSPEEILRIQHAARMVYEKVYDESVGRYYYFNAHDQSSSWELPSEFNGDGTFLLTPRSRELMVLKMDAGTWKTSETMTKEEAARTIQGMYKRRKARKLIVQAIQNMYEKIYDEQSNMFFYFNKRTQASIWTKPPLLGYWDDVPLTPRSKQLQEEECLPRLVVKGSGGGDLLDGGDSLESMESQTLDLPFNGASDDAKEIEGLFDSCFLSC